MKEISLFRHEAPKPVSHRLTRRQFLEAIPGGTLTLALILTGCKRPEAGPTAEWSATGEMVEARFLHTASLLPDGRVLVVGGLLGYRETDWPAKMPGWYWDLDKRVVVTSRALRGHRETASAEVFDPVTRQWSPTAPRSWPSFRHTATVLLDGRVLVAGGWELFGEPVVTPEWHPSAELYDPASRQWSPAGSMAQARVEHTATLLADGRVLVTGGTTVRGEHLASRASLVSAEIYDPAAGHWSQVEEGAIPPPPFRITTAVPPADGRVRVPGGMVEPPWGFDWSFNEATLLPDGRVLATGFVRHHQEALFGPEYEIPTWAKVYDPSRETWFDAGRMAQPRSGHSATVLADGRVLIAGGTGKHGRSAEIYDPAKGQR